MFKFAWISCAETGSSVPAFRRMMDDHDIKAIFVQGDTPYIKASSSSKFGITAPGITKTSTQADIELWHAMFRAEPSWAEFLEWMRDNGRKVYYMPDDHEWGGDNWDHTITQANSSGGFTLSCSTQEEVNAHWRAGIKAARQYMGDNPENTDTAAIIGDIPSEAIIGDTPDASDYPINYFRIGYDVDGNIVQSGAHIEFFAIDCISYRSPIAATDDSNKTMLGATQKAWLKSAVVASQASFRPIMSNKKITRNTGADNTDIWGFYTTERDEILAHFSSNGITAAPWLAGDRHVPQVTQSLVSNGFSADVLCVTACPLGVDHNSNINSQTYSGDTIWKIDKPGKKSRRVYGLGTVHPDRLVVEIRDAETDGILWGGYIESGSNVVQYERTRIG